MSDLSLSEQTTLFFLQDLAYAKTVSNWLSRSSNIILLYSLNNYEQFALKVIFTQIKLISSLLTKETACYYETRTTQVSEYFQG